jgi:hypothetical protein
MSQIIPIYVPTYISSVDFQPARVLPRLLFYNGQIDCERFYVKDENNAANEVKQFPYFDNYNTIGTNQFPTTGSNSLLFYNESTVYGEVPLDSLYSSYWQTYVELLYNPRTRLLNASAIIPLADYFKMELNDVVQFRGNYYHLRAINDYNLKNGECQIQLLGPILPDALPFAQPVVPTTTTTSTTSTTSTTTSTSTTSTTTSTSTTTGGGATLAWSFSETGGANGYMDIYVNGSIVESRSYTSSGTRTVYSGDVINVEINCQTCGDPDNRSNVWCTGINNDADCKINDIANIFTPIYTVQPGDIGTTLNLDCFAACAGGCL